MKGFKKLVLLSVVIAATAIIGGYYLAPVAVHMTATEDELELAQLLWTEARGGSFHQAGQFQFADVLGNHEWSGYIELAREIIRSGDTYGVPEDVVTFSRSVQGNVWKKTESGLYFSSFS